MHRAMAGAGFDAVHTLHFPQPVYPSGWWSATLAGKGVDLRAFRREDAAARAFDTLYYNEDVHAGALATPPFMARLLRGG